MKTNSGRRNATRGDLGRFKPILDGLEVRLAMAQGGLAVALPVAANPAPAAISLRVDALNVDPAPVSLAGSPSTIEVGFSQPIRSMARGGADFSLAVVNPDGSTSTQPGVALELKETLDPTDPNLSMVIATPESPLPVGRYELILNDSSPLGSLVPMVAGGATSNRVLSTFSVSPATSTGAGDGTSSPHSGFGVLGSGEQLPTSGGSSTGGIDGSTPSANPPAQPTVIQGLQLDSADPESTSATGLTLQLSGPISVDALAASAGTSVELLDSTGQAWSMTPTSYDPIKHELSFVFDQALPAGTYTVAIGDGVGLLDPEGRTVATPGQATGVLGQIVETASTPNPDDFGVLSPGLAKSGQASSLPIAADGTASKEFVVLVPAFYSISGFQDPGQLSILRVPGGSGTTGLVVLSPSVSGSLETFLTPGVYRLNLTGQDPATGATLLTVLRKSSEDASLLGEGVGQAASQGTKLLTSPADPVSATSSTFAGASATPVDARSGSGSSTTASLDHAMNLGSGSSSSSGNGQVSGFEVVGQPVGRPSLHNDQVSVVSSSANQGAVALASSGASLPSGPGAPARNGRIGRASSPRSDFSPTEPLAVVGEGAANAPGRSAATPEGQPEEMDRLEGFDRALNLAFQALESPEGTGGRNGADEGPAEGATSTPGAVGTDEGRPVVEMASFASPIGLLAAAVVAIQYRRLRKARNRNSIVPCSVHSPLRGPHRPGRMAPRARTWSA